MDIGTQPSLINRLKTGPAESDWERFYQKSHGVILSFACKQGLDEHSACDVLQETMMVVMRQLPAFDYDVDRGRFRNWLLTIVNNKVREARRRAHASRFISLDADNSDEEPLHERIATDGLDAAAQMETGWRQSLLEEAMHRLLKDPRTNADTVAVFRAVAMNGEPVSEVAARFSLKENAVYQIKNRLLTRLQGMIAEMEGGALNSTADMP